MTGTVMSDGRIGVVGAIALKLAAAHEAHFRQVLVPDEQDDTEPDVEIPFLLQVSPVSTVFEAYGALTELTVNR